MCQNVISPRIRCLPIFSRTKDVRVNLERLALGLQLSFLFFRYRCQTWREYFAGENISEIGSLFSQVRFTTVLLGFQLIVLTTKLRIPSVRNPYHR